MPQQITRRQHSAGNVVYSKHTPMLKVKEIKAFLADKDDDMDFDFLVTAIEWVVKTPKDKSISEETTVIDVPEEKAVADEIAD